MQQQDNSQTSTPDSSAQQAPELTRADAATAAGAAQAGSTAEPAGAAQACSRQASAPQDAAPQDAAPQASSGQASGRADGAAPDSCAGTDVGGAGSGADAGTGAGAGGISAAGAGKGSGWDDVDNDDYGVPARKISYEEALELSRRQPGLSSIIFMIQVSIFCIFGSAFAGFAKASSALKEMAPDSPEVLSRLAELAGPFADMGAMGAAIWFMLSSLCGCAGVIVPIAVYNAIARSPDRSHGQHAGMTMYDLIKAEILKYSIMVIILVAAFKFTDLNALVIMAAFVVVMFVQILRTSLSLGVRS